MKKIITVITGLAVAFGVFAVSVSNQAQEAVLVVDESVEVASSNVGDGLEYTYWITNVNGNEVHGKPMNRISSTNAGIFLYKDEIGQDVSVGDKVVVVWGEYEDEFASIEVLKK